MADDLLDLFGSLWRMTYRTYLVDYGGWPIGPIWFTMVDDLSDLFGSLWQFTYWTYWVHNGGCSIGPIWLTIPGDLSDLFGSQWRMTYWTYLVHNDGWPIGPNWLTVAGEEFQRLWDLVAFARSTSASPLTGVAVGSVWFRSVVANFHNVGCGRMTWVMHPVRWGLSLTHSLIQNWSWVASVSRWTNQQSGQNIYFCLQQHASVCKYYIVFTLYYYNSMIFPVRPFFVHPQLLLGDYLGEVIKTSYISKPWQLLTFPNWQ